MRSHHLFAAALQSHAEKQAIELPVAYNVADMKTVDCLGQPSWKFASDRVEAWITRLGGHLGPVNFRVDDRVVSPFSVAPWAEEDIGPGFPPHLRALRGDFFCAPFGGNEKPCRGETHPDHGEAAGAEWKFESLEEKDGGTKLHLSLNVKVRRGRIDKHLALRPGENRGRSHSGRRACFHRRRLLLPGGRQGPSSSQGYPNHHASGCPNRGRPACDAKLLCIGGSLRKVSGAMTGESALRVLNHLRADWALIGASGLNPHDGCFTTELSVAEIKREALARFP